MAGLLLCSHIFCNIFRASRHPCQLAHQLQWVVRQHLLAKTACWGIWSLWTDSLGLSQLVSSLPKWPGYKSVSVLSTLTCMHTHTNIFLIGSCQAGRLFLITWFIITAPADIKQPTWRIACSSTIFTYVSMRKDKTTKCKDSKTQDAERQTQSAAWREGAQVI